MRDGSDKNILVNKEKIKLLEVKKFRNMNKIIANDVFAEMSLQCVGGKNQKKMYLLFTLDLGPG
jgi:hypothetical protein